MRSIMATVAKSPMWLEADPLYARMVAPAVVCTSSGEGVTTK